MKFFKYIKILGVIVTWADEALKDGSITADEFAELINSIAVILEVLPRVQIFENENKEERK